MRELWDFAKQVAQSEGRRNDWVYIVDVYKSVGGKEMTMEIYNEKGRFEVLGEAPNSKILISDKNGNIGTILKSELKTFRKRFYEKEIHKAEFVKKAIEIDGKKCHITLYLDK